MKQETSKIKLVVIIISILICALSFTNKAFADGQATKENNKQNIYFVDDANLFSDSEESSLKSYMNELFYDDNCGIVVATGNGSGETTAQSYYRKYLSYSSGVIFFIDMKARRICIFSDGDSYSKITSSVSTEITDNVYKYATNGDYYKCVKVGLDQIDTVLGGSSIVSPMRYINNLFMALAVSSILMFIIVVNNRKKVAGIDNDKKLENYTDRNSVVNFYNLNTVLIRKTVRSSDNSSGGGGGGGSSSGGGGSHSF